MSDEQLNTAIDEVARRLTEGSPAGDAGFRGRVLARIGSGDAPRPRRRSLFVFAPLATVAAIVLALVVARQAVRLPPSPQGGFGGTSPPSPHGFRETGTPKTTDVARTTVRPPSPHGFGGIGAGHSSPIEAIDAIDVAPLGVDPLAPDPIPIERLETIVPLVISPLDSTEEQRRHE